MAEPDPVAALVAFLRADTGIAALVGTRVFGGELDEAETKLMPRAAIVVDTGGGTQSIGSAYQEYGDARYDLRCYAKLPHSADALYRVAHRALKQMTRQKRAGVLLHWARPAGGPISLRDGDTDWPYVFASYQVLAAEVSVA